MTSDPKLWSKVSGWNMSKNGRGTVFRHFLENEKMCLSGETSNSFEVATEVGCAKKEI